MTEQWMLGTVVRKNGALGVRLDSEDAVLRKMPRAPKGTAPAEGDRVLLLKLGGNYLIAAAYSG